MRTAARSPSTCAATPMAAAIAASTSQTINQRSDPCQRWAIGAATRAVAPMSAPPQPGTALNPAARSIVARMYCRLSAACACNGVGAGWRVTSRTMVEWGIHLALVSRNSESLHKWRSAAPGWQGVTTAHIPHM